MKKVVLIVISFICAISMFSCSNSNDDGFPVLALQQNDERWASYVPAGMTDSVGPTGCGMFSIINAVHYLTGYDIDVFDLVDYASLDGSYRNDGTYRYLCYNEGGTLERYLEERPEIKVEMDKYWGGGQCGAKALDEYLDNGKACIIHIKGHFMCVAAHDIETNKYLVLDSAANPTRGTSPYGAWLTSDVFNYGAVCGIDDGFCVLTATESPIVHDNLPNPKYDYSVNLEIGSGKGKAIFDSTGNSLFQGSNGDVATYTVTPAIGYRVSAIVINGRYLTVKDNGKKATYEYEISYSDVTINVYFARNR